MNCYRISPTKATIGFEHWRFGVLTYNQDTAVCNILLLICLASTRFIVK